MPSSLLTNVLYEHPEEMLAPAMKRQRSKSQVPVEVKSSAAFWFGIGWTLHCHRLPPCSAAAAAAASTAKASEAASKPAASAAESSTSAERSDSAVPAAPSAHTPTAETRRRLRVRAIALSTMKSTKSAKMTLPPEPTLGARSASAANPLQRDVASPCDAGDDAREAGEQPWSVRASAEFRRHVLATCFAGKAVRDELFQVVADFDPHLAIVDGEEDQQAVVLAALTDAAAMVLEHLHRVLRGCRRTA